MLRDSAALIIAIVFLSLAAHATDPTTSATGTSNGTSYTFGAWTASPVSVSLGCNAGGSQCANTSYCIDTGNTCDPTTEGTLYSSPVELSSDGIEYMRFASDDGSGNWGSTSSIAIEIDTTPPVITLTSDASANWEYANIISVGVSDGNGSGVASTMWIAETTPECDSGMDSQFYSYGNGGTSVDANNDTLYQGAYICFRSTDEVGNSNYLSSSQITHLDTTPPVVSAGPDVTKNSLFTQSGQATDSGSGVASLFWEKISGPGTVNFGSPNQAATTVSATADGSYVIGLEATDYAGNNAVSTFDLEWDTTPPAITVSNPGTASAQSKTLTATSSKGSLSMSITNGSACDNTLQFVPYESVTFSSESDNGKGICYRAVDEAGNMAYQMSARIIAIDRTKPVITLVGNPSLSVEAKTAYVDVGATATDNYDGDITSRIVTNNSVNTDVIGDYTVTYDVSDAAGNAANRVVRNVDVVDTTKPVITLVGNSTITIGIRTPYADPGATAYDNYDGDITSKIVTNSTVNTNAGGTYTVTYDVSDSSGNKADEVTRTVKVNDILPLIALICAIALVFVALVAAVIYTTFIKKRLRGPKDRA